mgnify:CR=1 FL=1
MKSITTMAAICGLLTAMPAVAQTVPAPATTPAPAPAPAVATIVASPTDNVLRAGTVVPVKTAEALTTKGKKLKVGQRIQLEVSETVFLGGQAVLPAGSPVTGEITDVRNKGMWGKSGRINARVLFVRVNGRQIRLTGAFDDKGVTGTAGVVAAIAFVPVAGFFTTGTSAQIPIGAPVKAFLDEDLTLQFANVAPAPAPLSVAPATAAPAPNQPAKDTSTTFTPNLDEPKPPVAS